MASGPGTGDDLQCEHERCHGPLLGYHPLHLVAVLLHLMQLLLLQPTLPSQKTVLRSDLRDGPQARDEVGGLRRARLVGLEKGICEAVSLQSSPSVFAVDLRCQSWRCGVQKP